MSDKWRRRSPFRVRTANALPNNNTQAVIELRERLLTTEEGRLCGKQLAESESLWGEPPPPPLRF